MMRRLVILGALMFVASAFGAMAEDDAGRYEYMIACSTCHGETGQGDGPLAEMLTVKVPDLTRIAADHDGAFPFLDTMMIVDGRTGVRGHGSNMPVWGDRFERDALKDVGVYGAELIARGRLMALVEYLEAIQQ